MSKKKKPIFLIAIGLIVVLLVTTIYHYGSRALLKEDSTAEYIVLGHNDLGMHCIQKDYSKFLLLPPANNLQVQVFKTGENEAELITKDIVVKYELLNNTSSADKVNFWDYATAYGYSLEPNIGITGNGLTGEMKLSQDKTYFEATAIPVTPYCDDSNELQPYQLSQITVLDEKTGKVLVTSPPIVVPVSNEMECSVCHGTEDTDLNILMAHDEHAQTNLLTDWEQGKIYKCADCHQDNALGAPGKPNVPPLSQAMHGAHANRMDQSSIDPTCYSCHPGPVTQCSRGAMAKAGISCIQCHGDMNEIANSQQQGRSAWLNEPNCASCHGALYQTEDDVLYRNGYLTNGPSPEMNNKIQCAACHNAPHSEWPAKQEVDNLLPLQLQQNTDPISCNTCHQGSGKIHNDLNSYRIHPADYRS